MRSLRVSVLTALCALLVATPAYADGIVQWGTCADGPAVITDANSGGELVPVGSLVELWDTQSGEVVATAHIGNGFYPPLPGRVVKISRPANGSYSFQMIVYNVVDPYVPDLRSCAVVVGGTGRGSSGIDLQVSAMYPAAICFPSAEIPTWSFNQAQGGGCRVMNPLAVILASFDAFNTANGVLLRWETTTELQNRGFNLYRAESEAGPWTQLNDLLIPSQGMGSPLGFVYEYLDPAVTVGATYYYLLEDVSIYGQTSQHGPVSLTYAGVPTAITLAEFEVDSQAPQSYWTALLAVVGALAGVAARRKRRAS